MTIQDQPKRKVRVLDLRDGVHEGILTCAAIRRPSWMEELIMMSEDGIIELEAGRGLTLPQPQDSDLLVLELERAKVEPTVVNVGSAFLVLPQVNWPANDERFDDFFGSLRSLMGQKITWQATISGTVSDPRLGRIVVQYGESENRRAFGLSREEVSVSRKVSMPRIAP